MLLLNIKWKCVSLHKKSPDFGLTAVCWLVCFQVISCDMSSCNLSFPGDQWCHMILGPSIVFIRSQHPDSHIELSIPESEPHNTLKTRVKWTAVNAFWVIFCQYLTLSFTVLLTIMLSVAQKVLIGVLTKKHYFSVFSWCATCVTGHVTLISEAVHVSTRPNL